MIYDIISKNETSKDKVKQNSNGGHQTSWHQTYASHTCTHCSAQTFVLPYMQIWIYTQFIFKEREKICNQTRMWRKSSYLPILEKGSFRILTLTEKTREWRGYVLARWAYTLIKCSAELADNLELKADASLQLLTAQVRENSQMHAAIQTCFVASKPGTVHTHLHGDHLNLATLLFSCPEKRLSFHLFSLCK